VTGAAIELRGAGVRYETGHGAHVDALAGVDLAIQPGEFVVLLGPSGQGKSTALNVMAGLLRLTSGEVLAAGEPVTGPGRDRGMVFQEDTVLPWMRVEDNVAWGLQIRGLGTVERKARVHHYLEEVGLAHVARAWPKELSGGMRKRVSVATAFAADPDVLLMDEPFGPLDFVTRTNLHRILIRLWREERKTVVFVTHDVDEALLLADRIVVLRDGRVAEDLPVTFERPRTDELRADPDAIAVRRHLLVSLGLQDTALPVAS
jgi:NitT/TauT family transport system ATP-binding protein